MNPANMILTQAVPPPVSLEQNNKIDTASEEQKKQYAKEFESVFISKLLDEMKNTIGDWGFEKDGASKQTQGIFWLYLARDIANNGGFGLWEDIYKTMGDPKQQGAVTESLDKTI